MTDLNSPPAAVALVLGAALGCGLLMGVERERRKGTGPGREFAGIRSFTLAALAGGLCMVAGGAGLMVVGAAMVAGLGVVAYWRDRSDDPGVTTELALLLAYLIGALCAWNPTLAAALAVGVTALLAARERMHRFARQWLSEAELRDGLVLAALALITEPLLPDRAFWGPVLNPHALGKLLVLLLLIQAFASLAGRLLHARQALVLSALAAGFVSSTATIATLGVELKAGRRTRTQAAGAATLTCVSTLLQLLAIAATVQPTWLGVLWWPAFGGMVVLAASGLWLLRGATAEGHAAADQRRLFSLRDAVLVALLLSGMQVLVHAVGLWLGDSGMVAAALLGALVDMHAAAAAVLVQGPPGMAGSPALLMALMGAVLVHNLSKGVTAWLSGGGAYALTLAPGLALHVLVVVGGLAAGAAP